MKVDFSIREALRVLVPRERGQGGRIERVGKIHKKWRMHWYVYGPDRDERGMEKRHHKARTLRCDKYTRAQAMFILAELISAEGVPPVVTTLDTFYHDVFLPTRQWAKSTAGANQLTYQKYIFPAFGGVDITAIKRHQVESFFLGLAGKGRSTLNHVRSMLNSIFVYAVGNDCIERNPVGKIRLSRIAKPAGKTKVLTIDQAQKLCHMTGEHGLVYRILLTCGLRIGELLALRWNDVRLGVLMVDESVEAGGGVKGTKSGESREVPLPAELSDELATRRNASAYQTDEDFIFPKGDGTRVTGVTAHNWWVGPATDESGIAGLDFHSCRRTLATLLSHRGAQTEDVQAILGHSEPATTERHYIKPVAESQRRAVCLLAADLMGSAYSI